MQRHEVLIPHGWWVCGVAALWETDGYGDAAAEVRQGKEARTWKEVFV